MSHKPLTLVDEGARFLDTFVPDWFDERRIDITALDARLTSKCVMGQLYEDYLAGIEAHKLSQEEATRLCFSSPRLSVYPSWTEDWRNEVLRRWVDKLIAPRGCEVTGFGPYSVGVQGDARVYLSSIFVSYPTDTTMETVSEISNEITNKVKGITRVLMDIPIVQS